jgi:hypothetical protein
MIQYMMPGLSTHAGCTAGVWAESTDAAVVEALAVHTNMVESEMMLSRGLVLLLLRVTEAGAREHRCSGCDGCQRRC